VLHGAELLEFFDAFERARLKGGECGEKVHLLHRVFKVPPAPTG
jgi:hypothetical protein